MSDIAKRTSNQKLLLMGNEAIARGAIEGGVNLVSAYPGTPSSEVCEALIEVADDFDYYVEWSLNEKVAFEVACGASQVGGRSIVVMKNAGLNVAMDTLMTIVYGGVRGGMVVVVADDPNAHYSSNEQDTRFASMYAEMPCFEPADQQEAKDMVIEAFEVSERLEIPVFLRSVSRISHASGDVRLGEITSSEFMMGFNKHWKIPYRYNVYGPPGPVSKHRWLHELQPGAIEASEKTSFTMRREDPEAKLGVITSGVASSYVRDFIQESGETLSLLKLGIIFPLPKAQLTDFLLSHRRVAIIEEGDPVVENQVRSLAQELGCAVKIMGKTYNSILAPYGELNPDLVEAALKKALGQDRVLNNGERDIHVSKVVPRSSTLCAGCSHLGSYWALKKALKKSGGTPIVNGDIGCYEQGGYGIFSGDDLASDAIAKKHSIDSPYEILDTIYVMGSGIGMAQGQKQVGYEDGDVVAVCGDSTFFHSTLSSLANAVYNKADITFIVLNNSWTAMTGHQPSPMSGLSSLGQEMEKARIEDVSKSMGVEHVQSADAYHLEKAQSAIEEALSYEGPSVVVLNGECALQKLRREGTTETKTEVHKEECIGCKECIKLGCPAVIFDPEEKKASIDEILCTDCKLCLQVCPTDAIMMGGEDR